MWHQITMVEKFTEKLWVKYANNPDQIQLVAKELDQFLSQMG